MDIQSDKEEASIAIGIAAATALCFDRSHAAGWWTDLKTGKDERDDPKTIPLKIALMHSELSEALEGHRKQKVDEHLPSFLSLEVELADACIRIFDTAGAYKLRLAEAILAKLAYNASRADHKPDARAAVGGKAF